MQLEMIVFSKLNLFRKDRHLVSSPLCFLDLIYIFMYLYIIIYNIYIPMYVHIK